MGDSIDIDPFIDANDERWFRLGLDRAIPALLRKLASEDHDERTDALAELAHRVYPDGDLNYASAPVAGFLARLAIHQATDDRAEIILGIEALLGEACGRPSEDEFGPRVIGTIRPYLPAIFNLNIPDGSDLQDAIQDLRETWTICRHRDPEGAIQ